jgi:uncharacterized protein YdiU (UPF0061 family)
MGRVQVKKTQFKNIKPLKSHSEIYGKIDSINGSHNWQQAVPEACVMYPAKKLNKGKVVYFNFNLAKEMGLIPSTHSHKMNPELHKKLIDTFSIQIINEYDQKQNIVYHPSVLKKNKYMATRYLQLQHSDKKGRTSGDGRSIWNGMVEHKGKTWDVSSRGTGVTCLAPGAVDAKKPLKTGSFEYGYGCGTADMDELIASALMSEVFYANGLNTERVLLIVDLGKNLGIGVRAAHNLFRPAHLFLHLKQNNIKTLKKSIDYIIDRQFKNGEWDFHSLSKNKYKKMIHEITSSFAKFTATLDREYIFAWLDWDGDNVLANAGIIDYGSIRQFGLRHDEYRYDDVDRLSTTLKEQKIKSKQIIQTFAQMCDFLETNQKKSLGDFATDVAAKKFDELYNYHLLSYFLKQVGFDEKSIQLLITKHTKKSEKLFAFFSQLECLKTKNKRARVPDGYNRPAILNMRAALVEMAQMHIDNLNVDKYFEPELLFKIIISDNASRKDHKMTTKTKKLIVQFQRSYFDILKICKWMSPEDKARFVDQARSMNRLDRLTGDSVLHAVDKVMKFMRKNKNYSEVQHVIENIINNQKPTKTNVTNIKTAKMNNSVPRVRALVDSVLELIDDLKESI